MQARSTLMLSNHTYGIGLQVWRGCLGLRLQWFGDLCVNVKCTEIDVSQHSQCTSNAIKKNRFNNKRRCPQPHGKFICYEHPISTTACTRAVVMRKPMFFGYKTSCCTLSDGAPPPPLKQLHWLSVCQRILYKLCVRVYLVAFMEMLRSTFSGCFKCDFESDSRLCPASRYDW